jgi:uncharacterized membrane protein YdjX (TVP38/TMEM64 family)
LSEYIFLFLIVMGVNLMPAFGPPTWTILVLYSLNTDMRTGAVVLTGAAAAALGRYVLATAFRFVGTNLPKSSRDNLDAARKLIEQSRGKSLIALPSAQLFEAAGLMGVRLLPFTAAFFSGRLASYFVYAATAARVRETTIGDAFRESITRPVGIAVQLLVIAILIALTRINWARWLSGPR